MLSPTFLSIRHGLVGIIGAAGLFSWGLIASAQYRGDPYQPDSSPYISSTYPTLPNNLALPGQAREARDYLNFNDNAGRSGIFERYINGDDTDSDIVGTRRGRAGVPYFEASRQDTQTIRRESSSAREADLAFHKFEAEKNRRYQAAIKEKDPAKRAKLLREVSRMRAPQSNLGRGVEVPKKTTAARAEAARPAAPPAARPSIADALAAEALSGDSSLNSLTDELGIGVPETKPRMTAPTSTIDVGAMNIRRQRSTSSATTRPPLPSETSGAASRRAREVFDRNGNRLDSTLGKP